MNRKELFGNRTSSESGGQKDGRTRVVEANEKLYKQNVTMNNVTTTANEMDERTRSINEELLRQRQNMEGGIVTNKEIHKDLNRTNYLEDTMSRRECWNKTLLWMSVLILTGVNVFLLMRKLVG